MSSSPENSRSPTPPNPGPHFVGRGSSLEPESRFSKQVRELDLDEVDRSLQEEPEEFSSGKIKTIFYEDLSRSIVSDNDSPDLSFRYSLNPYRGCEHGCAYCYARPTHEYLDLNAGIDFETRLFVKPNAAALFKEWIRKQKTTPDFIAFSGVTDCYQPIERNLQLTRACLEVALAARLPIRIVTKNHLVTRDLDLFRKMNEHGLIQVGISLTSLDQELTRTLEPRTGSPKARLQAIRELSDNEIPVFTMLAPIIPGINDSSIPELLEAAKEAGAEGATYTVLRLPWSVEPVFVNWLEENQPSRKEAIISGIRKLRGGKLYNSKFGERMRGTGIMAEQIHQTFQIFARKHGLNKPFPKLNNSQFDPTCGAKKQRRLF
ncbi:PA0069 family radical SAM protein [Polystyrenella longa]|nr:PA0069 family radical SAM protein [Polystyrenella longa]